MPADRSRPDNPQADLPEIAGKVRPLRADERGRTLAEDLIPVADDLRQLVTDFGLRPYQVFLVHVQWAGPARGIGLPTEISRREVLPTPRVEDMGGVSRELSAVGLTEMGGVRVSKVSAKYSEDDLLGRTPDLRRPDLPRTGASNVEFYWEIVQRKSPAGESAVRRRFAVDSAADLKPGKFGWTVSLKKQQADAARDGKLDRSRL